MDNLDLKEIDFTELIQNGNINDEQDGGGNEGFEFNSDPDNDREVDDYTDDNQIDFTDAIEKNEGLDNDDNLEDDNVEDDNQYTDNEEEDTEVSLFGGPSDETKTNKEDINLLDSLNKSQKPSKNESEKKALNEDITELPVVSSGMLEQTQKYLDNLNSETYNNYLEKLDIYFSEYKKQSKDFLFFRDKDGVYHKKCKEKCTKKENETEINPPKYIDVTSVIKQIKNERADLEFNLFSLRDKCLETNSSEYLKKYDELKKKYENLKKKQLVFSEYIILANKENENRETKLNLLVKKAETRNKLRVLYDEIKILYNDPDKRSELDKKIKEYLETNKIIEIEKEIKELEDIEYIDKAIEHVPENKSQPKNSAKKLIKKKPKKVEAPEPKKVEAPKPKKVEAPKFKSKEFISDSEEDIPVMVAPKKKKIIKKKKQVGKGLDMNDLLSSVSDEINIVKSEQKSETPENNIKSIKIDQPINEDLSDTIEELDLSDDISELTSSESDETSDQEIDNYSFEKTYDKNSDDEIDTSIPLDINSTENTDTASDGENIEVKVIKLNHT